MTEHLPHTMFREPSVVACDFLHRYPVDRDLRRYEVTPSG